MNKNQIVSVEFNACEWIRKRKGNKINMDAVVSTSATRKNIHIVYHMPFQNELKYESRNSVQMKVV